MARGCMPGEDGARTSHAGRSPTRGPVPPGELEAALGAVFADARVTEVIVQEWVDGPSGVALSLDPDDRRHDTKPHARWLVEYARAAGAVTAGRVSPFCASLPNDLPRYASLQAQLELIGKEFGACDVEFVGLGSPRFVQVRPLTAPITQDGDMVRVKQVLQELDEETWHQNALCIDLMERPEQDGAWLDLFVSTVAHTYERMTGLRPELGPHPFLKLGRQLFCSGRCARALRLSHRQALRVGLTSATVRRRSERVLADPSSTAATLMDTAIELNLHADLTPPFLARRARRLFTLRERCRQRLSESLPRRTHPVDAPSSRRLAPELALDSQALCWKRAAWREGAGLDVVPGADRAAPTHRYDRRPERVPEGVLLHTEELYPELAEVLPRVAGIVCAGGGVTSHLAILCREARVPLRIQVGDPGRAT
jgi:phosphohistidine swiveling domain-containing protein